MANSLDLILRRIDTLPTLPAIAVRLLSLTSSEESHTKEVVELVQADPALTAKVISMCRSASRGVSAEVLSVERAVVLLGFSAVRNAVLSLKLVQLFGAEERQQDQFAARKAADKGGGEIEDAPRLDRRGLWLHSLAVATAAERIAAEHDHEDIDRDDAFVCGLLHDVGKLGLDTVLPKAYARVLQLTQINTENIATFERRVLGLDHHTAGKRLAEQWGLPLPLQDAIWLHGSPLSTHPQVRHRRLIGLITLADLVARQQHIGFSGNHRLRGSIDELATQLNLDPQRITTATKDLHDRVQKRAGALGLGIDPSSELFLESIQQANAALGRMNAAMERRSRLAQQQAAVLEAVQAFHVGAARRPARCRTRWSAWFTLPRNYFNGELVAVLCPPTHSQGAADFFHAGTGSIAHGCR